MQADDGFIFVYIGEFAGDFMSSFIFPGKGKAGETDRRHNKGCNCKRSGCLKNYCECYEVTSLN